MYHCSIGGSPNVSIYSVFITLIDVKTLGNRQEGGCEYDVIDVESVGKHHITSGNQLKIKKGRSAQFNWVDQLNLYWIGLLCNNGKVVLCKLQILQHLKFRTGPKIEIPIAVIQVKFIHGGEQCLNFEDTPPFGQQVLFLLNIP